MIHLIIYRLILFFVFLLNFHNGIAQSSLMNQGYSPNNSSKWYFGGNFGLSFGTISSIYIAPLATYAITEKLHGGLGISYEYYSNKYYTPSYNVSTYGGKIFARYFVFQDLFGQIEYEKRFYRDSYYNPGSNPIASIDGIYAGAGYRQWMGANAYTTIIILFDLTDNNYSFGINPFIRVGMGFGI